jgi:hypothetical protein
MPKIDKARDIFFVKGIKMKDEMRHTKKWSREYVTI